MATFYITLKVPAFKDGGLSEPITTSVREGRAKRHARKLRAEGQRNVMLWKAVNGTFLPISFKATKHEFQESSSHLPNVNSPFIDLHPDNGAVQSAAVVLNQRARQIALKVRRGRNG